MLNQPFAPAYEQTQTVDVSNVSTLIGIDELAKQVRVLNPNAFVVWVRCSSTNDDLPATSKDYPIGPNSSEVITKADTFGAMSLIASGTNTGVVYVTPGEGFQSAAA